MLKNIIRSGFDVLGLDVRRKIKNIPSPPPPSNDLSTMYGGFVRAKQNGITPKTILDVGAAEGKWTKSAMRIWPDVNFCMIEPLVERKDTLTGFASKFSNVSFVNAALGKTDGEIPYYISNDLDGSGAINGDEIMKTDNIRNVPVTTANKVVLEKNLQPPYVIKLDTHGFEVPILEGADKILPETSMLIIECYGLRIQSNALVFWEMCQWLDRKGFAPVDIVDIVRRPSDKALWQCDIFFYRKDHQLFQSDSFV